ncbi:hypothetical protein B9Q13_01875 [Candidatus Marsarchaeota G2 archaeon ECH_B_SAG-G16]|uniref:Uncharacterized protein n=1 Tax=Candidatus Marsarchaeota G2 archaeon ECH_B_SAG-G16 TaxID=1978167 RepID=A0A2R6C3L8_9ARCH|nr:MAG: hypothetical protein B9Q13_01875 [Candidatus Marsarchaeota G2 archaeon ECH_B_SAG-G16]
MNFRLLCFSYPVAKNLASAKLKTSFKNSKDVRSKVTIMRITICFLLIIFFFFFFFEKLMCLCSG